MFLVAEFYLQDGHHVKLWFYRGLYGEMVRKIFSSHSTIIV